MDFWDFCHFIHFPQDSKIRYAMESFIININFRAVCQFEIVFRFKFLFLSTVHITHFLTLLHWIGIFLFLKFIHVCVLIFSTLTCLPSSIERLHQQVLWNGSAPIKVRDIFLVLCFAYFFFFFFFNHFLSLPHC